MPEEINSLKLARGKELLPIGTVVTLEFVEQAVMVYGRMQKQEDDDTIWDYVACPYPQGHISDETNVFFHHGQIGEIIYKGLITEGELVLREKFKEFFKEDQEG